MDKIINECFFLLEFRIYFNTHNFFYPHLFLYLLKQKLHNNSISNSLFVCLMRINLRNHDLIGTLFLLMLFLFPQHFRKPIWTFLLLKKLFVMNKILHLFFWKKWKIYWHKNSFIYFCCLKYNTPCLMRWYLDLNIDFSF